MKKILLLLFITLYSISCDKHEIYPGEDIDPKTQYLKEITIYVGAVKTAQIDEHGLSRNAYYYKEKGWNHWGRETVGSFKNFNWEEGYIYKLKVGKVKWKGTAPADYGEEFYVRKTLSKEKATGDEVYNMN